MDQKTTVESSTNPKKPWTEPVIKVISLNSAKNGGSLFHNDGSRSRS
jgi:hypothetical protein